MANACLSNFDVAVGQLHQYSLNCMATITHYFKSKVLFIARQLESIRIDRFDL